MKAYTIKDGTVSEGIAITEGVIDIGEEGRGRKLVSASVPQGAEQKDQMLLTVPSDKHQPTAVTVAVRDHSGFRGSWSLGDQTGIDILAQGACAQGSAGRMGGGPEYLLVITDGGSASIYRTGRLYGKPSKLTIKNIAGVLTVEAAKSEANTDCLAKL